MFYLEIILKSVSTYCLMLIFIKVIGKAGFAQLTPYDLTFVLILAAVLGAPLVDPETPYYYSLIVFVIGLAMQQLFSRVSLKNKLRKWVENEPTVIIVDGNLIKEHMVNTQFDMVQLLAALRLNNIRSVSEVELGTLEPNGDFSIIKKGPNKKEDPSKSTYLHLKNKTLQSMKDQRA